MYFAVSLQRTVTKNFESSVQLTGSVFGSVLYTISRPCPGELFTVPILNQLHLLPAQRPIMKMIVLPSCRRIPNLRPHNHQKTAHRLIQNQVHPANVTSGATFTPRVQPSRHFHAILTLPRQSLHTATTPRPMQPIPQHPALTQLPRRSHSAQALLPRRPSAAAKPPLHRPQTAETPPSHCCTLPSSHCAPPSRCPRPSARRPHAALTPPSRRSTRLRTVPTPSEPPRPLTTQQSP